jgi:hypothetical protein
MTLVYAGMFIFVTMSGAPPLPGSQTNSATSLVQSQYRPPRESADIP